MVLGGCGCGLTCVGQVKSSPFRGGRGSEGGWGLGILGIGKEEQGCDDGELFVK